MEPWSTGFESQPHRFGHFWASESCPGRSFHYWTWSCSLEPGNCLYSASLSWPRFHQGVLEDPLLESQETAWCLFPHLPSCHGKWMYLYHKLPVREIQKKPFRNRQSIFQTRWRSNSRESQVDYDHWMQASVHRSTQGYSYFPHDESLMSEPDSQIKQDITRVPDCCM